MSPHEAAIQKAIDRWTGCVQTAFDAATARELTVTKAGEALIEVNKRYADEACACKDTACFDRATAKAKQAEAELAKPETTADTMSEALLAHTTRAAECDMKLLQAK